MTTLLSFIAAMCSLAFSLLTFASFYVGMDNVTLVVLACMSVVSFGHAWCIYKI